MTLEDLKIIQKIETEVLFDIVDVCEKHNIEYFLMFGTLLGAVRHGGHIPWDDDVDIGMTRENYLRFLEVAPAELDARNEIHLMGSGDPKLISELKIGRKGTLLAMPGTEDLKVYLQVGVDIFPVDCLKAKGPNNMKLCLGLRTVLMLTKLNWDEKRLLMYHIDRSAKKGKWAYKMCLGIAHAGRAVIGEKNIERLLCAMFVDKSGRSSKCGTLTGDAIPVWDVSQEPAVKMKYNGRFLSVHPEYEQILRAEYGDYMQFPPEDKRYRKNFEKYVFSYTGADV